jgi:hypothetical protein
MARLVNTAFDPARICTVRRPFTANGRQFQSGDVFDWRRMAVSQRKAYLLFEAGKLMHAEDYPNEIKTAEAFVPVAPTRAAGAPAASIEPEVVDDLTEIVEMRTLRAMADEIGAAYARSLAGQRAAIRAQRAKNEESSA